MSRPFIQNRLLEIKSLRPFSVISGTFHLRHDCCSPLTKKSESAILLTAQYFTRPHTFLPTINCHAPSPHLCVTIFIYPPRIPQHLPQFPFHQTSTQPPLPLRIQIHLSNIHHHAVDHIPGFNIHVCIFPRSRTSSHPSKQPKDAVHHTSRSHPLHAVAYLFI